MRGVADTLSCCGRDHNILVGVGCLNGPSDQGGFRLDVPPIVCIDHGLVWKGVISGCVSLMCAVLCVRADWITWTLKCGELRIKKMNTMAGLAFGDTVELRVHVLAVEA